MDDSMLMPRYVLETEEVSETRSTPTLRIRISLFLFGILLIFEVFYFLENGKIGLLEDGLSLNNTSLLIFFMGMNTLASAYAKVKGKNRIEFKFYSDHLRINRPEVKYKPEFTRREEAVIKYADILSCEYFTQSKKLILVCTGVNHIYNDDGQESDGRGFIVEKVNFTEAELVIDTCLSKDIDFKKEFEEHSPIVVVNKLTR